MKDQLKLAVDSTQKAQRNYDLTKHLPDCDLDTLIYSAVNSPSKQNETHYCLYVYTDQKVIREIYNQTKLFSLMKDKSDTEKLFKEENGKFWQNKDMSVHNSQILANAIFVYVEERGTARSGDNMLAQQATDVTTETYRNYMEQINYSIGISVGELILTASLLGYKTGLCSAFAKDKVQKIIGSTNLPKLIVGVGYEIAGTDRRLHAETLNRDVAEKFRTGPDDEHWRFPTFTKDIKVLINGTNTSRT